MQKTELGAYTLAAVAMWIGAAQAAPLPGGANSLSETYEDWTINCEARKDETKCVMNQMQNSPQTGQRVLAAELSHVGEGKAEGVLVMPFGLDLSKGVSLKVDEGKAEEPQLNFSTCLPQGCLVPLSFDSKQLAKLKTAANLNVGAVALSPSQALSFRVSLKGFSSALDRIGTLTQ